MNKPNHIKFLKALKFPLSILLFIIIPLSILINPELIPRLLGETSSISKYGYLDLEHYISIAKTGYNKPFLTAFYPLWPKILNLIHILIPISYYKIAISISVILGFLAFTLGGYTFEKLCRKRSTALIAIFLYVLSPMTVFFFSGYTESLFAFQSLILINLIFGFFESNRNTIGGDLIRLIIIFCVSLFIGLTRPILLQTAFALTGAGFITLKKQVLTVIWNKTLLLSFAILSGVLLAYYFYGTQLIDNGYSFLQPFNAQKEWGKALGLRPIFLFAPKSPIIDLWALYYPAILVLISVDSQNIIFSNIRKYASNIFNNLPLFLLYPPFVIIYSLFTKKINSSTRNELSSLQPIQFSEKVKYIFWFSVLFSFSHSLICFMTQPESMRSLGRYVFGQPYFYISLALFLDQFELTELKNKSVILLITILISSVSLLINFIDFGNAKLVP